MGEFAGKVAFITGAAHGQGRATALALAREGARIGAFDIARPLSYPGYDMGNRDDLASLAEECRRLGTECLTFQGDVRDDAAITMAVNAVVSQFGRIDILFNNAGICAYGLAHELTEEAWDTMLDINLKGSWLVARRVIPVMIAQKAGVIINNSSVAGLRGMGRLSHYAASKWGLTGLTKSWAIELAPHGIRVNSMHPTGVNTPMNDGLAALEGLTPAQIAERSAGNLLPVPWIEPEDVAQAVLYLASDRARYVTGAPLILDAGLLEPLRISPRPTAVMFQWCKVVPSPHSSRFGRARSRKRCTPLFVGTVPRTALSTRLRWSFCAAKFTMSFCPSCSRSPGSEGTTSSAWKTGKS